MCTASKHCETHAHTRTHTHTHAQTRARITCLWRAWTHGSGCWAINGGARVHLLASRQRPRVDSEGSSDLQLRCPIGSNLNNLCQLCQATISRPRTPYLGTYKHELLWRMLHKKTLEVWGKRGTKGHRGQGTSPISRAAQGRRPCSHVSHQGPPNLPPAPHQTSR
jgi:hypothetical protein